VVRGGSWGGGREVMRTADRDGAEPYRRYNFVGMRLVVAPN